MSTTKAEMRRQIRACRRARSEQERTAAAAALRDRVLTLPELRVDATRVAAYLSAPDEPGTGPLIEALAASGVAILVPVLLADFDLDWALLASASELVPSQFGGVAAARLLEPAGARLGPDAIASADLVLVPALAVDRRGRRLGQGGGSYDRALVRVPPGIPQIALLFDDELVSEVPAQPHDRTVTCVVTPTRLARFA